MTVTAFLLLEPWAWWAIGIALGIVAIALADRYEHRLVRARESLDERAREDVRERARARAAQERWAVSQTRPYGCGVVADLADERDRRRGGGCGTEGGRW